jgi:hypothetical protein
MPRVKLKEEELVFGMIVQVFHCTNTHIADQLCETNRSSFHLLKPLSFSDRDRYLLGDFLMSLPN